MTQGIREPVEVRFWRMVEPCPASGCWLWTGAVNKFGYGKIGSGEGKKVVAAHRLSFLLQNGYLPDQGRVLDHLCHVRSCVNPAHLRVATPAENSNNRAPWVGHWNSEKTHCKRGHELSGDNLKIYERGGRAKRGCKACDLVHWRNYRERKAA